MLLVAQGASACACSAYWSASGIIPFRAHVMLRPYAAPEVPVEGRHTAKFHRGLRRHAGGRRHVAS
jgi:hypothetical protein